MRLQELNARLDRLLARRPGLVRTLYRYGMLVLAGILALAVAGGTLAASGRSQELVYATTGGSVVALEPESGEVTPIYRGEGYAGVPSRSGGSRSLAFPILWNSGDSLRASLYSVDLVRGTRARLYATSPGEAFAFPEFSTDRNRLLAARFTTGSPPDTFVSFASGVSSLLLEPDVPDRPALLGSTWVSGVAAYTWAIRDGSFLLTAYDVLERRQAVVYETGNEVGPPSYYREGNTVAFAERPPGAGLEGSKLKVFAGSQELPVSGAGDLGLYDPGPLVPSIGEKIPVMWTDGEEYGVGLLDPANWSFEKTGVKTAPGSRHPQFSRDGSAVSATSADGTELTVRRAEDGSVIREVNNLQPPETMLSRLREAGYEVPSAAERLAPAHYGWKSLEES